MKAMIVSDFLSIKSYILSQSLVGIVVGIFISASMGNAYMVAPLLSAMIPFSLLFTVLAYDERNGWQEFRLTLPLSRTQVIAGRYGSYLVFTGIGLGAAALALGIVVALASLFPAFTISEPLGEMLVNFSWQALAFSLAVTLSVMTLLASIILPLVSRFGLTTAVRFVPLALVFGGFAIAPFLLKNSGEPPVFITDFLAWIQTDTGALAASAIALAVALVIYAISCALATKLYAKREV
ncbi:MAG: ABC-2 transporter permease [Raoultibacter sp.]